VNSDSAWWRLLMMMCEEREVRMERDEKGGERQQRESVKE
jgi:hypothetical protein